MRGQPDPRLYRGRHTYFVYVYIDKKREDLSFSRTIARLETTPVTSGGEYFHFKAPSRSKKLLAEQRWLCRNSGCVPLFDKIR